MCTLNRIFPCFVLNQENFATEIAPSIRHLHLDHNLFTGSIPSSFRELGKGRLRQLYLNDCHFSGKFPENWLSTENLNNIDLSNNEFKTNLDEICLMSVFENGELVELRADCPICNCERLCRTCRDNIDFLYEYDDDDWVFDDDSLWLMDSAELSCRLLVHRVFESQCKLELSHGETIGIC